jgi:hypothetical protein
MRRRAVLRTVSFAALAALAAGPAVSCARSYPPWTIVYVPASQPVTPTGIRVRLAVADARSGARGGGRSQVGVVRGQFGDSRAVFDSNPNVVTVNVGDATTDALWRAGISVNPIAPKVLEAWVNEFWMDGFVGYGATVMVVYQLKDAWGRPIWHATLRGQGGDVRTRRGTGVLATEIFQSALSELARNATAAFASPDFQRAAAM